MVDDKFKTILVVDDAEIVRLSISSLLAENGYQVLTANNGLEAMAVIADDTVDLIITDILMPEMDGIELLQQLKKSASVSKVIAISGGGSMKKDTNPTLLYLSLAMEMGANRVLAKPFSDDEIINYVRELLDDAVA